MQISNSDEVSFSPLPGGGGGRTQSPVLAMRLAPEFSSRCTKASSCCRLPNKGRGRSAERRVLLPCSIFGAGARHAETDVTTRPALNRRARLSALLRGHAPKGFYPLRLGPGQRFLESPGANGRTLPGASSAGTLQSATWRTG